MIVEQQTKVGNVSKQDVPRMAWRDSFLSLFGPTQSRSTFLLWLGLCLLVSVYYSSWALMQAFGSEYVVQDDARHHVVWLQSFTDPELFRGDLIADYFRSLAGPAFSGVYWLAAQVGIDALLLGK